MLLEDYEQHGMQYCVDKFVAAQAPTTMNMSDMIINQMRTGQFFK